MRCEHCARKGTFSVSIERSECGRPANVIFAREIATTYEEKGLLLDDAIACIGRDLVRDERELLRIRVSIDEGLQNAFSHGNKEDPAKRIRLEVFESGSEWGVIIADQGAGFTSDAVRDPRTPEGRAREHGRGLMIMWKFMDDVSYFDGGKTLRLLRRKQERGSLTTA
ncbi:MAG TPA: hypothetical protein DCM87_15575 [Planctomycetes bacterium]|nr:hypothetical protein [Planctomycetota bacterium]